MENTTNLSLFQKFLKFLVIPTIVANLIKSLTMDEGGFSLKKIMAVYGLWKAAKYSDEIIASPNFTMQAGLILVGIWIVFIGICVGLYSWGDIAGGLAKVKGTASGDVKKEDEKV